MSQYTEGKAVSNTSRHTTRRADKAKRAAELAEHAEAIKQRNTDRRDSPLFESHYKTKRGKSSGS